MKLLDFYRIIREPKLFFVSIFLAMEMLSHALRQIWTGRGLGKTLLMVGVMVAAYQAYKRWRRRRALSRLSGKVVLITGASSGLGEGGKAIDTHAQLSSGFSLYSSGTAVSWLRRKGHSSLPESAKTAGAQIPTGQLSVPERGVLCG